MISASRAKDRIKSLSANELRDLTVQRLLGQDTTPVERARADEPSEDLVIALLQIDGLAGETRAAVIQGLREVHLQLYTWLVAQESRDPKLDAERLAVRYCRTIDVASPTEMFPDVSSLLRLVLDLPGVSTVVQKAVVRAALGYPQREAHVELWNDALTVQDLAPYALSALLQINPRAPRIQDALIQLFRRKYCDDWPVNAAGLLGRANRARGDEVLVSRVLSALKREATWSSTADERWEKIKTDLQRTARTGTWLARLETPTAGLIYPFPSGTEKQKLEEGRTGFAIQIQEAVEEPTHHVMTVTIRSAQSDFDSRRQAYRMLIDFAEQRATSVHWVKQDIKLKKNA